MYSGMWQIVKRLLPEEAMSRINFPSGNELLNYFDEDSLLIGMLIIHDTLEL